MGFIDADKLILVLSDYAFLNAPILEDDSENSKLIYDTIQSCIEYVKEQPTIYGVIKIV